MAAVDPFDPKNQGAGGAPSASAGGGAVDPFARPGSTAPGVTNPTAGLPSNAHSSNGGGGILGFLSRAVKDTANIVNPLHVVQGYARLGMDLGKAPLDLGEKVLNTATGTNIGNAFARDTNWTQGSAQNELTKHLPAINGIVQGAKTTVGHSLGLDQLIAHFLSGNVLNGAGGPLGQGYENRLKSDYSQHPVGSAVNDLANLSVLLGLGGAAAGKAGAAGLAEDLGKGAQVVGKAPAAPVHPVSTIADILGGAGERLQSPNISAASEALGRVTHPFSKLVGVIQDAKAGSDAAKAIRDTQMEKQATGANIIRENNRAFDQIKGTGVSKDEFQAGLLHSQFNPEMVKAAASADPAAFEAMVTRMNAGLPDRFRYTPEAARLAQGLVLGTLPEDQAGRIAQAESLRQALVQAPREVRESDAYGHVGATGLNEHSLGLTPNQEVIDKATAKQQAIADRLGKSAEVFRARADRAAASAARVEPIPLENGGIPSLLDQHEASLRANQQAVNAGDRTQAAINAAENKVVKPTYTDPRPIENPRNTIDILRQARANLDAGNPPSNPLERALARQDAVEERATAANEKVGDAGEKVIDTYTSRGHAAGTTEGIRTGKAQVADRLATLAESRAAKAMADVERVRAKAADSLDAAPAPERTQLATVRNFLGDLTKEAGAHPDPAIAEHLAAIAKDLESHAHLDSFKEPLPHTIGASSADIDKEMRGRSLGGKSVRAAMTAMKSERARTGTATLTDIKGQQTLENSTVQKAVRNETVKQVLADHGQKVSDVIPDAAKMSPTQRYEAVQNAGMEAWNPTSTVRSDASVPATGITPDTVVIPKEIHAAMANQMLPRMDPDTLAGRAVALPGQALDFATKNIYRPMIALSPHLWAQRIAGNAMLVHAEGVKASDFLPRAKEALSLWRHGEVPAALERHLADNSSPLNRVQRASQFIPRAIDGMAKTMVYLQKAHDGASWEEAVRMGAQSLGDIAAMSGPERSVLYRLVPSYPWMKAVATAAGHLGEEHPAAVLMALHLADIAGKDQKDFKQGPIEEMLNPGSIFAAGPALVNPFVKMVLGATSGVNVNKNLKPLTRESGEGTYGPIDPKHLAYYLTNQLPLGKLYHQSPLYGQDQRFAHTDTGDIHIVGNQVLPASVPPSVNPQPIPGLPRIPGTFGPYFSQMLGNPKQLVPNLQGLIAQAKAQARQQKTESTYRQKAALLAKMGIR